MCGGHTDVEKRPSFPVHGPAPENEDKAVVFSRVRWEVGSSRLARGCGLHPTFFPLFGAMIWVALSFIWMISLALRSFSRLLKGRTRTATLTDDIVCGCSGQR